LAESTGGSIVNPASFCGVVGLCPTYGRVSRYGLIDFANSLDKIGPLAKTVEQAALMLEVMAGFDENESTTLNKPVDKYIDFDRFSDECYRAFVEAVKEARANLRSYVEETAQNHVDAALDDVASFVDAYQVQGVDLDFEASDDLEDIAQKGADALAYTLSDWAHHVTIEDDDL